MTVDCSSIESLLTGIYEAISGPAGSWQPAAERDAFWPDARLCRSGVHDDGTPWLKVMSFEQYVADVSPFLAANDFYEHQTDCEINRFGNVAQVRSSYEARRHPADTEPERRGVNFVLLYHDGHRWWILSMAWDNERPESARHNI